MFSPLGLRDGALTFTRNAVFTPDGLVARGEAYRWEDVGGRPLYVAPERWPGTPAAGWAFELVVRDHWALTASVGVGVHTGAAPHYDEPATIAPLGSVVAAAAGMRVMAAYALASYLRDEPRARAGLAEPPRTKALHRAVHALSAVRSGIPREPLMGDAHDLHWAAARAFRHLVPRRYDDRRVDADPAPTEAELANAARLQLRTGLRDRVSDGEIAKTVGPFLARPPWPFGLLL